MRHLVDSSITVLLDVKCPFLSLIVFLRTIPNYKSEKRVNESKCSSLLSGETMDRDEVYGSYTVFI